MTFSVQSGVRHSIGALLLVAGLSTPARSQSSDAANEPVSLSGPRFGVTVLSQGVVDKLQSIDHITVQSPVSQFGWQFEKSFKTGENGISALNEWVVLVGGLDQGLVLPSVSWLVGVRTRTGFEFGVGPNLTPVGAALALVEGMTFHAGSLNIPVNLAVVPSKSGIRVSVLTGFNTRRH
jgi:hypothetical protein